MKWIDGVKGRVKVLVKEAKRESKWPEGYRILVKEMKPKEGRTEGFAYYEGRTIHVNPAVKRLTKNDLDILLMHEIAHHLQSITQHSKGIESPESKKAIAGEEKCAMKCEKAWAGRTGIQETAKEWLRYRKARAALDAKNKRKPMSVKQTRDLFSTYGVPKRLVRPTVELKRVTQHPGEVKGYINGKINDSPCCPLSAFS